MKRNDLILIGIVLVSSLTLLFFPKKNGETAIVTHQGKEILTIDLRQKEEKDYEVTGTNGTVKIHIQDGKIKVNEENSPLHLCSKQGYIEKAGESIVCLPNEVVIEIIGKQEIDTVVR